MKIMVHIPAFTQAAVPQPAADNRQYPLAHLVDVSKPFRPGADVAKTIADARKNGPLVGPVRVVREAPFDLNHPMHPRFALRESPARRS